MQIEKLLEERNMRDSWLDFWQKESTYCSQVNLTADTHGIILDWHKQSLKQFIDGLVESNEELKKGKRAYFGWETSYEMENKNGYHEAIDDNISHLKEITKQLV